MKFIDLNSLPRNLRSDSKRFYVDLGYIGAVAVQKRDDDWAVAVSTPVGFVALLCEDEAEADEIALKLIKMIEEVRSLPLKAQGVIASDMMDKLKGMT